MSLESLTEFEKWLDLYYSNNPYYSEIKSSITRYKGLVDSYNTKKILNALLITNKGLLITSAVGSTTLDLDIFSSMLTAINDFVRDTIKDESNDHTSMRYGNYNIQITRGQNAFIALMLNGNYNETIKQRTARILTEIEKRYATVLPIWDGKRDIFTGIDVYLRKYLVEYNAMEIDPSAHGEKK
jgi:hypothetical protein